MKNTHLKKVLGVALLVIPTLFTQAQISIGAKGGLNVSNLNGIDDIEGFESKSLVAYHLGGFVTFNLGRHFAIQPEVLFSSQGAKIEGFGNEETIKTNYFHIPVMAKFLTTSGFYVEAGPQFGFRVSQFEGDQADLEDEFKDSDIAGCVGLGWQPTKSPFGIGARYNIGLGKTADIENVQSENVDVKSGVFQLSLYWRIFGGGKLKDNR